MPRANYITVNDTLDYFYEKSRYLIKKYGIAKFEPFWGVRVALSLAGLAAAPLEDSRGDCRVCTTNFPQGSSDCGDSSVFSQHTIASSCRAYITLSLQADVWRPPLSGLVSELNDDGCTVH